MNLVSDDPKVFVPVVVMMRRWGIYVLGIFETEAEAYQTICQFLIDQDLIPGFEDHWVAAECLRHITDGKFREALSCKFRFDDATWMVEEIERSELEDTRATAFKLLTKHLANDFHI